MELSTHHILSIRDLTSDDVALILETATSFKEVRSRAVKKVPALRGRVVTNCFFENSTRTRISFEMAAKSLSADLYNISYSNSSISKGETIQDTLKTMERMKTDIFIIRHPESGMPKQIANIFPNKAIINAGDGSNEHPTQALVDLYTIVEKKGSVQGLNVVIVGDILHSRVARSNMLLLKKMGADVTLVAPKTLLPIDASAFGVYVSTHLQEAIKEADVVMMLRIQQERMKGCFFPNLREYSTYFGLTQSTMAHAVKNPLIMHPGPVNRGIEIDPILADSSQSVIFDQVENGVSVRMALLYLLSSIGGEKEGDHVE